MCFLITHKVSQGFPIFRASPTRMDGRFCKIYMNTHTHTPPYQRPIILSSRLQNVLPLRDNCIALSDDNVFELPR